MNGAQKELLVSNLDAHLIILREEVRQETKNLNGLLLEKADIEATLDKRIEIAISKADTAKKSAAWHNLQKKTSEEVLKSWEADLEKRERNVALNQKVVEETYLDNIFKVSLERTKLGEFLDSQKERAQELEETIVSLKRIVADTENDLTSLNKSLVKGYIDKQELEDQIVSALEVKKSVDVSVLESKKELAIMEGKNYEESTKIASAQLALDEREKEANKRERGLAVLKYRISKVFKMLYPEQDIDNLI